MFNPLGVFQPLIDLPRNDGLAYSLQSRMDGIFSFVDLLMQLAVNVLYVKVGGQASCLYIGRGIASNCALP